MKTLSWLVFEPGLELASIALDAAEAQEHSREADLLMVVHRMAWPALCSYHLRQLS